MTYANAMNKAESVNSRNDNYRAVVIRTGPEPSDDNDNGWDIEISVVII